MDIDGFVTGGNPGKELCELRRILQLPLEERRAALMKRSEEAMERTKKHLRKYPVWPR